jgi:two-component system repressor protein LuxO
MTVREILLIEDTPSLQLVYASVLRNGGHRVQSASNATEGADKFRQMQPPVVILDLMLPDRDGLDLMSEMLAKRPETRVVVVTANGSINKAVEAMRLGAYEFLVKPFDETRFLSAVSNALADYAPGTTSPVVLPNSPALTGFIGRSGPMQGIYQRIVSVSRSMATVFITGESGTGKEVCAQAVHDTSNRASKAFVPLNCGAIPNDLLESEVFGHLKGSFTGAIQDKPGAAAAADGGTLFLDEICEMDLNLQTKLLRFLQTSTIQPVGAPRPRKVNVRIICATNRNPLEEVRKGRFREDLYFRLQVVPIHLPPLRERGQDAILIARDALARFNAEEGRNFQELSPEVQDLFRTLPWPGNVRQLLNVLRNIVVLNDGPVVTTAMLPLEIMHHGEATAPSTRPADLIAPKSNIPLGGLIGRTMAEIEQLVIEATIAQHGGSIPKAARVLDLSPSTIYRKRENWTKP